MRHKPSLVVVSDNLSDLGRQWRDALADVIVRYPVPTAVVTLTLRDEPTESTGTPWAPAGLSLSLSVDAVPDTTNPTRMRRPMTIAVVGLDFFPGDHLARVWVGCAWAGYLSHEALELVTIGDFTTYPISPHSCGTMKVRPAGRGPAWLARANYAFRETMPNRLTAESFRRAIRAVYGDDDLEWALASKPHRAPTVAEFLGAHRRQIVPLDEH